MKTTSSSTSRDKAKPALDTGIWFELQERFPEPSRECFSKWMDENLEQLELRFGSFQTPLSIERAKSTASQTPEIS